MSITKKMIGLGAGLAAIAAATPAAAQYYGYGNSYGYSQPYGYSQSYGYDQPYGYAMNTNVAASQCSAAVQNRLYNRSSIGGILGAVLGTNTSGRVVSVTEVTPRNNGLIRVRGLASSGRYASNNYGAYGVGAYGALGYGYANAADLSFRCDVAPNGAVYSVSINRR
ncbi:MAG TPA: hypothetical protein VNR86_03110 [Sphingomicrobium sp.]|nr:hypothetical protein [Sphingomicrobium sp.]